MFPNLTEILATAGTIIVVGGALGLMYATLKSKLPQSTIDIQNESIAALQRQNTMLKEEIQASVNERLKQMDDLTKVVAKLQARVEVLETIPLTTMADSMKEISQTLAELRDMGRTNQALIKSIGAPGSNITINK